MTPAEIAEDLRHLADDVGMTDAETADKVRALITHVQALERPIAHAVLDPIKCWYEGVATRGELFGPGHIHRELSLLRHIAELVDTGDIDRPAVLRMARWLTDRYGEPDA